MTHPKPPMRGTNPAAAKPAARAALPKPMMPTGRFGMSAMANTPKPMKTPPANEHIGKPNTAPVPAVIPRRASGGAFANLPAVVGDGRTGGAEMPATLGGKPVMTNAAPNMAKMGAAGKMPVKGLDAKMSEPKNKPRRMPRQKGVQTTHVMGYEKA